MRDTPRSPWQNALSECLVINQVYLQPLRRECMTTVLSIVLFGYPVSLGAWAWAALAVGALVCASSFVRIHERQVGIVIKRYSRRSLPPGRLVALEGEAGYQADTLAPGIYFG